MRSSNPNAAPELQMPHHNHSYECPSNGNRSSELICCAFHYMPPNPRAAPDEVFNMVADLGVPLMKLKRISLSKLRTEAK
ncbi:hypothetical protein CDAR_452141 [Caerostris darwini]|uniref:Uncharacterized protein n=1 Tax=Caerostris darwini TaxID=1538125 RepID=A0AAV4PNN3_9ARAC|nr:hypothetical protein CDAR_452141 [Caerostris darwini]